MLSTMVMALGVIGLSISILLIPVFRPDLGVYVTVAALGFAVALQKYVASFAGFFVLRLSRLFDVGDRIRIGNIKGDVRHVGLLHFILDEVGEGEKFGGELTGRILHIPNHTVLDQPVLNFSQAFSVRGRFIPCDYMFDEVRVPIPKEFPVGRAVDLMEGILQQENHALIQEAKALYSRDIPTFLTEAEQDPRTIVFVEASAVWVVGKYVASIYGRNQLKSTITIRFLEALDREKIPARV